MNRGNRFPDVGACLQAIFGCEPTLIACKQAPTSGRGGLDLAAAALDPGVDARSSPTSCVR
jgi:hypothetical protein